MNTYTHFLLAVVLSRWILPRKRNDEQEERQDLHESPDNSSNNNMTPAFDWKGALLGSVLPDLPLIATTVVCTVRDHYFLEEDDSWTEKLFESWYFSNPWVEAEQNIFHSPVSLTVLISVTYLWHARWSRQHDSIIAEYEAPVSDDTATVSDPVSPCYCDSCSCICSSRFWYWAFVSALFHALCDIPVHHDDGPLLFWRINWSYRFESPLSYWDPNYYGIQFSIGENILDFIIIVGLLYHFCRSHHQWCKRPSPDSTLMNDESGVTMVATNSYKDENEKADDNRHVV
mmetsp:Transcript_17513/g.20216  ORF Transcript_17513/g.20216 Transcript_17513/m.20216 type:complete len:287 (-) Transcript_17513:60-920(-)